MSRLHRVKKQKIKTKQVAIVIGIILLVFAGAFIMRLLGFYNSIQTKAETTDKQEEQKTVYNILLLGYGGGSHDGAYLTDTLMVARVDIENNKALLISLPRDLSVKVPGKEGSFDSKINEVYQYGLFPGDYPGLNTKYISEDNPSLFIKKVAEDITGLEIDYFAAIDFQGFVQAIDTLGGIQVQVDKTFTDYEYPIEGEEDNTCEKKDDELDEALKIATESSVLEAFPCRFETLFFQAGITQMDGETALKFARSRHALEDGGDFNRAKRQQKVIEAVQKKVINLGFLPKILPLLDDLEGHILTDVPLGEINKLLFEAREVDQYRLETFVVSGEYLTEGYNEIGQYVVYPKEGMGNWSAVKKSISNMIKGIIPTPTRSPTTSPI